MSKVLAVLAVVLLSTGCATMMPVAKYTCLGCGALVSSGVCSMLRGATEGPNARPIAVPDCLDKETVVVRNWDDVVKKGARPVLGCAKEKR